MSQTNSDNEFNKMCLFPKISQEAIHDIDATPDKDYPLRILRTYREQTCSCRWKISGDDISDGEKMLFELMNKSQEARAAILDLAIEILERGPDKVNLPCVRSAI